MPTGGWNRPQAALLRRNERPREGIGNARRRFFAAVPILRLCVCAALRAVLLDAEILHCARRAAPCADAVCVPKQPLPKLRRTVLPGVPFKAGF